MRLREADISGFFAQVVSIGNDIGANNPDISEDRLKPLADMLGDVEPSRAYLRLQGNVASRMEAFFEGIDWEEAAETFKDPASEDAARFLQKLSTTQTIITRDEIRKETGVTIFFPSLPVAWSDNLAGMKGKTLFSTHNLDPRRDNIFVNGKDPALTGRAGEAAVTVSHETWHLANVALSQAVRQERLKEEHPLYHDGLYYKCQIDRNAHYTVGAAYKKELDERMAVAFGDRMAWWLQRNEPDSLSYKYDEDGPVYVVTHDTQDLELLH